MTWLKQWRFDEELRKERERMEPREHGPNTDAPTPRPAIRELATIESVYRQLELLSPTARVRVLRYVSELLAEAP